MHFKEKFLSLQHKIIKDMKIFAVGMNYIQHNKELDGTLYKPEKPVIFTKADSALLKDHKPFFIPDWSEQVSTSQHVTSSGKHAVRDIPGRSAKASTVLPSSVSGWISTSSETYRRSIFISISTARRYKKAVRVTCSTRSMS